MSYEEEIRKKHRQEQRVLTFEGQVQRFLKNCRKYRRQELELLMARLLDRIQETTDQEKVIDYKFKGSLTKMVFDERVRGQKKSTSFWGPVPFSEAVSSRFSYPYPLTESSLNDLRKKYSSGAKLLTD